MAEGVERSGVFGIGSQAFNVVDDTFDGTLSELIFGEDYIAGYRARDPIVDAISVSIGTAKDVQLMLKGLNDLRQTGSMSWGSGSAIRRLTWTNNLFYTQYFNQEIQKQIPFIRAQTN